MKVHFEFGIVIKQQIVHEIEAFLKFDVTVEGATEGQTEGIFDGDTEGRMVGITVGYIVGTSVGTCVGGGSCVMYTVTSSNFPSGWSV